MTVFTGTAGTDTFLGTDYVADEFHFDPSSLDASDSFDGGLSTGFGDYDSVVLAAGTYAAADFAGMAGIERIVLSGPATLEVDAAMLSQSGSNGLIVETGPGDDVVDLTAVGVGGVPLDIVLGGGNDIVYGGAHDETFTTDPAAAGDYTLYGGDGDDDFYIHGTGAHVLDGGGDRDWLWLVGNVGPAELDLRTVGTQLTVSGGLLTASVAGFEVFYATYGDDLLRGDGDDQEFWALVGDDTLDGRGGDDFLDGDVGDDTLRGGAGDDILDGDGGSDTADYANASDNLDIDLERAIDQAVGSGVSGTDTLRDIENVDGGHGADLIAGDAEVNTLRGGDSNDALFGRGGDDVLYGEGGDDVLDAGSGYGGDLLDGGAGLDTADFSAATTDVFVDLVSMYGNDGLARTWTLLDIEGAVGGSGNDSFYGDGGANRLNGRQGADDLHGLDGDDQLRGGNGMDTLDGGSGDDLLVGGNGADLFIIADTGAGHGYDTVEDFQDGLDFLELHGVDNVVVNSVGADCYIDMFDAAWAYIDTVRLIGAAGLIDVNDYALVP